jgi:hypothetical protein
MTWAGLTAGRPNVNTNAFLTLVNSPRSWSLSDAAFQEAIIPLRTLSGLPPLNGVAKSVNQ